MNKITLSAMLLLLTLWPSLLFAQSVRFVIPGDDSSVTATDFSGLLEKPAGASGFVVVKDGHFFTGSHLQLNTPKSQGVWGLIANQQFNVGAIQAEIGAIQRDYGTIVLTALDDVPITSSGHLLLLASSGAENTGMKWNADRTSVGDQWRTGPTQVNLFSAPLKLALRSPFTIHALD